MNNIFKIATIILVLALSCCQLNNQNDFYLSSIREWQNREISIPTHIFDVTSDSIIHTKNYDFKIITYIDSSGCYPCRLHLNEWSNFISEIENLNSDKTVLPLIIIEPRFDTSVKELLENENYIHPICVKQDSLLNILNTLPINTGLRTFLLDSNNKILIIGNPIFNKKISTLYKDLISSNALNGIPYSSMEGADEYTYDFGSIKSGDQLIKHFH